MDTRSASDGRASTTMSADAFADILARHLTERGILDAKDLDRAKRVAAESGRRLDAILTQLGLLSDGSLAQTMGDLLALPLAGAEDFPSAAILPERLRPKFLHRVRALPIAIAQDRLTIAMVDPLDHFTISAIGAAAGRHVTVTIALPVDFEAAFNRLYGASDGSSSPASGPAGDVETLVDLAGDPLEEDAERLKDLASEAPVIRLVNQIISRAVETRASDIHIEPFENRLRIRYRYDGVLQEVDSPPARLQAAITSRIKIMARLDIAERRLPQDGRINLAVRGTEVDFRVSTIPSLHGETVVLRVLDRSRVELDFGKLGLHQDLRQRYVELLDMPNGIVLVTGPTGSGKTTTLYTGLVHLNSATRKIVTVEDPIEYQLAGINQTQVKPQIGLGFASLLRSILRQDPDVIMIGEIRDLETAEIAVQAALTGHLVLSTLHTNSAAATISRLRDMHLEDYLLTATLNGVLAQRLVRRLCDECKRPVEALPETVKRFGLERLTEQRPIILHEAVGCPACRHTGYRGRRPIGELLRPTKDIHRLILSGADHGAIQDAATAGGMRTMYEFGLLEALAGTTTLEEMLRSVRYDG